MKITIYNGSETDGHSGLDVHVRSLMDQLGDDHQIEEIRLSSLDIKYCNGCWGCWVKEPGTCVTKDDIPVIHKSFLRSDLVIFATPLKMGFPNALTKKVQDKLIPLVHPYITLVNNESHHEPRYEKYPGWGLLLEPETDTSQADIELVSSIYERTALNIKTNLHFTLTTSSPVKEIIYEINHI